MTALGHFETKSDAFLRVYRSGPPSGADVLAPRQATLARKLVHLFTPPPSRQFYRPMIIAMAVMWVMQPSVDKVIDVITVRHLFVSAARTMRMRAPGLERAAHGVGIANLDNMFVGMIFMHVMQMTIVQIIDMVVMAYSRVPTVGAMLMYVIRMMLLGASGHGFAHLSCGLSDRASQCRFLVLA
jgi:hypothetical protein